MYEWPRTAEPGNPEICIVSFFCHVLSLFCRLGVSFVIFLSFGCVMCVSCFCQSCVLQMRVSNKNEKLQNNAQMTKNTRKSTIFDIVKLCRKCRAPKKTKITIYIYIYITEKWQKITKKRYVAMPKNDKNMVWSDISTMTPSVNLSRYNPTEPLSGGQFLQVRKGHLCWIPTFNQGLPVQPPYFMV